MILADVMDEIAEALGAISGLRVAAFPTAKPNPPQAIVSFPESITYDETYGRGMDRMSLPVIVVVGRTTDLSTRTAISAYCDGEGDQSIKAALESAAYTAMDVVRVESVEFDSVSYNAIEYLAALFTLDIAGQGA